MKPTHLLLVLLVVLAVVALLAYGASQQPTGGTKAKASASAAPAGWKTVTNDAKACKLSLPPAWVSAGMGGMWGNMEKGEMAMFIEDEETQQAGNWDAVHREIEKKKATGAKVEILEEAPDHIIFQAPQGQVLAVMSFRRSAKTMCAAQIAVAAGDAAEQKVAQQIARSLAPAH